MSFLSHLCRCSFPADIDRRQASSRDRVPVTNLHNVCSRVHNITISCITNNHAQILEPRTQGVKILAPPGAPPLQSGRPFHPSRSLDSSIVIPPLTSRPSTPSVILQPHAVCHPSPTYPASQQRHRNKQISNSQPTRPSRRSTPSGHREERRYTEPIRKMPLSNHFHGMFEVGAHSSSLVSICK